jgi:ABC-type amino acid transport substrate-binding protein
MKKLCILAVVLFAAAGFGFATPKADTGGTRVIKVGTEGAYPPYNYVTEQGEADGYDVAVVKAAPLTLSPVIWPGGPSGKKSTTFPPCRISGEEPRSCTRRTGGNIEIVYTGGNIVNALTEIETGRVDATLSSIITTQLTADSLGYKIEGITASELPVNSIHLLFPKTDAGRELRDRIDGALKTLLENGTLAELSKKYFFGKDYSTREALEANQ